MKYVAYTVSLYFNFVLSRLDAFLQAFLGVVGIQYTSRWAWWNPIITSHNATLYQGALPLKQSICGLELRNDAETLQKLGIRAVLSVTEPFENTNSGLFLAPITPQQWEKKNILHFQLPTPEFQTVPLEKIEQGVEFIHWNMQQGNSVYVHCKAGRARSALIDLCYLIKHHQKSAEEALQILKERRDQVTLAPDKWATAKEYELFISQPSFKSL